jgi:hypothetical protein
MNDALAVGTRALPARPLAALALSLSALRRARVAMKEIS